MSASAAVVLALPVSSTAAAEPVTTFMTKTALQGPLGEGQLAHIVNRRGLQGLLSQKILGNASGIIVIEEWNSQPTPGQPGLQKLEI
jgi:hypothetical protein